MIPTFTSSDDGTVKSHLTPGMAHVEGEKMVPDGLLQKGIYGSSLT